MHRMIPRPDAVFDLINRALRSQHAQNFINALTPVVVPSIFKMVLVNWDALFSERDQYTVAFTAVFIVDGLFYTLSLFCVDDAMFYLARRPGRVLVEVLNLHFLMMAMLAKFVWVVGTLFLSDSAKRMWISVEFMVQVVSMVAANWVCRRYVPDQAHAPVRSHSTDMAAKMTLFWCLLFAARNDLHLIAVFATATAVTGILINKLA
jgi:hypothetical protein